jgi:uncharacterized protein (TIGR02266 family)
VVKRVLDDGFLARVDLGPEQRLAFEEALRWAASERGVRAEPRFSTIFPVSLRDDDPNVARYVKNLSRKGAFIRTHKVPPVGTLITLQLRLPDGGPAIDAEARVVRAITADQAAATGGLEGVGVRFETMSDELKTRLDDFIKLIEGRAGKLAIVADDDALVRAMVSDLLEGQGIKVIQASSGDEVVLELKKNAPRLVLVVMDLTMPGRDGLELVSEVAQLLQPKRVPLVVLTGTGPSAAKAAIERGARRAILKGATSVDILLAIEAAMSGGES